MKKHENTGIERMAHQGSLTAQFRKIAAKANKVMSVMTALPS